MKKTLLTLASLALVTGVTAQIADIASNAAYDDGWQNGDNGGTGFGAWDLTNNNNNGTDVFAGYFIGDSTDGAADINTGGESFGIYANPGSAFATANRSFTSALSVNDQFTINLGVNFDNGNKGFNLRTGGTTAFGLNVGGGAQVNTAFTNNPSTAVYDYGGDALLQAVITVISANSLSYEVSRTSSQGTQDVLFSGTVTGISGALDNIELYNSGTDSGDAQNNLYFNNLSVTQVPEPSTLALLGGLLAMICLRRRF
ncbi:hypothetical protein DDZ13_07495 [Coraliomargarita sinensis]|uniref:Ice-binding protein C-terminal domain-containing protein n=1 Tax=Coraliomargarita sinensis TaxID=2174842 RepID=A0A317ZJF1_9BACT|nr:PEP-CTERM sorting domain-containing protein [Coraliomargarita sinensis]PXA04367.1 hypothetical protein DDZ13_07495 [Coraliomargarita sinensis]